MKKYIVLPFLLFTLTTFCQSFHLDKNSWHDFEGKLGETKVRLSIYLLDGGQLKGNYCYKKYENKIQLIGNIIGDKIELTEFLNGKPNGYLSGKLFTDNLDRFEGIWTDSSKSKTISFKTTLASICAANFFEHRYSDFYVTDDDVEKFMKHVKSSILEGDKEWIANHIRYPINTTLYKNKSVSIKNKKQLINNFDDIFHHEFKEKIKSFCVCNMFNNYQGVMLGDGQIWIYPKPNSTDKKFDCNITAINN